MSDALRDQLRKLSESMRRCAADYWADRLDELSAALVGEDGRPLRLIGGVTEGVSSEILAQRKADYLKAQPEPVVNWEASYHQACDDADAYKAEAEKRIKAFIQDPDRLEMGPEWNVPLPAPPGKDRDGRHAGWQPIGTAPKDGTVVLVWDGDADMAYYSKRMIRWYSKTDDDGFTFSRPTHWMPLPAPPERTER